MIVTKEGWSILIKSYWYLISEENKSNLSFVQRKKRRGSKNWITKSVKTTIIIKKNCDGRLIVCVAAILWYDTYHSIYLESSIEFRLVIHVSQITWIFLINILTWSLLYHSKVLFYDPSFMNNFHHLTVIHWCKVSIHMSS